MGMFRTVKSNRKLTHISFLLASISILNYHYVVDSLSRGTSMNVFLKF
jgi:hypothetical protein